jgi:hypothetical protein
MRYVSALSIALTALATATLAHAEERHFSRTVAAQPQGAVDVSNVSGDIQVSGWDRNEVSVEAELSDGVDRVDVTSDGGRTGIKVVLPGVSAHHAEAHLRIKIPKGSELDVSAVSANVMTDSVLGIQRLTAVSGDMSAETAGSLVELKTVSGDVRVKGHGQAAPLRITTVSGDVKLEHGGGDFELSTVSGTLVSSFDAVHSVRAHSTSGDLRFEGKLARGADFEASTVSGEIKVRAAAEGGFGYEVSSFSGDISDCFGSKAERTSEHGPGSKLNGTRGEGAGHLRLKTMSGDIELCDRS